VSSAYLKLLIDVPLMFNPDISLEFKPGKVVKEGQRLERIHKEMHFEFEFHYFLLFSSGVST
jgi:hypothetical protein